MIRSLNALAFFAFTALGAQAVTLDPQGQIRPDLLGKALAAHESHKASTRETGRLVVVDYSRHSREARLYIVNLQTGHVVSFRAAHGKGSDADHDGHLDHFSNESGSSASPEGAFITAEEYVGKHGRSLRLDGLDTANSASRDRAIVIHAADYAEPAFLAQHGKLGRSNGCIVFSKADLKTFLTDVPQGTLIFVGK
ncbi:murein L,D-transpeptidase catalytic domain family protein [Hyphomonas sp.]|uniref:murein L,D-transpeptidase catalytic domain family protein n=1 Tax=Hyphomonas sp. TaxID=87 RepID=UPI003D28A4D3